MPNVTSNSTLMEKIGRGKWKTNNFNHSPPNLTDESSQRCLPLAIDKTSHLYGKDAKELSQDFLLINDDISPKKKAIPYINNMIKSNKYTLLDFIPKQLICQFRKLANSYFLVISILQMIPGWSTTGSYTTIIPLLIFISISILREGYDDYKRYKLDFQENKVLTTVIFKKGQNKVYSKSLKMATLKFWKNFFVKKKLQIDENMRIENSDVFYKKSESDSNDVFYMGNQHADSDLEIKKTEWHNLRVGDLVIISNNENIPADLLLLSSTNMEHNEAYLETMALDGETNLKAKNPHQELYKECYSAYSLLTCQALLEFDLPNSDLYTFEGNLKKLNDVTGDWDTHPISLDNVCFRGSTLRNTEKILGLVIYTGEETKIRMNAIKSPRVKEPKLQRNINMIIVFMACVVAAMSLFSLLGSKVYMNKFVFNGKAWYLMNHGVSTAASVMGFIIMYNTLIPLSLYVTMEIIKLMQGKLMEWDIDMYHKPSNVSMESRTATILEELGQVSYIFSDKTGTLTDNMMLFKKFNIVGTNWEHTIEEDKVAEGEGDHEFVQKLLLTTTSTDSSFNEQLHIRPRISTRDGKTSIDFNNTGSTSYSGRPSIASIIEHKYPSPIREDTELDLPKIRMNQSIIDPNTSAFESVKDSPRLTRGTKKRSIKTQVPKLKSTVDLIRYIQKNPETILAKKVNFFLLCLSLCHTCLPRRESKKINKPSSDDVIEYQAASPDELALIVAARDMGYVMINKANNVITIKTFPDGFEKPSKNLLFKILNVIEFNSDRKRMSVILQKQQELNEEANEEILLICKGADNVILERLEDPELTSSKILDIKSQTDNRKTLQNEAALEQRKSLSMYSDTNSHVRFSGIPRSSLAINNDNFNGKNSYLNRPSGFDISSRASLSLQQMRKSISKISMDGRSPMLNLDDGRSAVNNIDTLVEGIEREKQDVKNIGIESKFEQHKVQIEKYKNNKRITDDARKDHNYHSSFDKEMRTYIGDDSLMTNEEYILESCLQSIDDFSTEGLRTLLYSYKIIPTDEYSLWAEKYHEAKTSLKDRKSKIDAIGGQIENNLKLLAATAIEDKLQEGVPEAIEKFKRAGIKLWMLTGDKRETAINIGYSCNLIYEYSSVVIIDKDDENVTLKMLATYDEILNESVAHCVVVIDGKTLTCLENSDSSIFYDLCMKCDSVIVCRASPSQKAGMVAAVKSRDKHSVTLAIGDGANDIAMIQSADIGIGIAGKEGLQASRTSDYSIGQFRFLLKLLLVHGRYNYSRTSFFVLSTFYKETLFYVSQMIFQHWTMFSGTSLYEPWSLSMFNTLFTSLPVLCIGMFYKDLKASTLLAIPELYTYGRLSQGFNFKTFVLWLALAAATSVFITFTTIQFWGERAIMDNTIYPLGFVNFTVVVLLINIKLQFIEMRNRSPIEFGCTIVSCGGWLVWTCFLPAIYSDNVMIYDVKYGFFQHFGRDPTMWATIAVAFIIPLLFDMVFKVVFNIISPSDASIFAQLEKNDEIRKKIEFDSYLELQQGWTWEKDPSTITRYQRKLTNRGGLNDTKNTDNDSRAEVAEEIQELNLESISEHSNSKAGSASIHAESCTEGEPNKKGPSRRNTLLAALNPLQNSKDESFIDPLKFEVLPSGKIIRKKPSSTFTPSSHSSSLSFSPAVSESVANVFNKTLRFKTSKNELNDEEIQQIIDARMKELEEQENSADETESI